MDNIELVLEDIEGIDLSLDTTVKIIKPHLQDKELTINENGTQNITADEGYNGLGQVNVTVNAIEDLTEELDTHDAKLTKQETTIYNIAETLKNKAISSGGGDKMTIYSLEETVIGTWIDGKPIYRNFFSGSTETGKNLSVIFENDASIDRIINCYGNIQGKSGEQLAFLSDKQALLLNANHKTITYFFNNTDSYSYSYEVVIEYTKTTD